MRIVRRYISIVEVTQSMVLGYGSRRNQIQRYNRMKGETIKSARLTDCKGAGGRSTRRPFSFLFDDWVEGTVTTSNRIQICAGSKNPCLKHPSKSA
jgi:hypothetical protein